MISRSPSPTPSIGSASFLSDQHRSQPDDGSSDAGDFASGLLLGTDHVSFTRSPSPPAGIYGGDHSVDDRWETDVRQMFLPIANDGEGPIPQTPGSGLAGERGVLGMGEPEPLEKGKAVDSSPKADRLHQDIGQFAPRLDEATETPVSPGEGRAPQSPERAPAGVGGVPGMNEPAGRFAAKLDADKLRGREFAPYLNALVTAAAHYEYGVGTSANVTKTWKMKWIDGEIAKMGGGGKELGSGNLSKWLLGSRPMNDGRVAKVIIKFESFLDAYVHEGKTLEDEKTTELWKKAMSVPQGSELASAIGPAKRKAEDSLKEGEVRSLLPVIRTRKEESEIGRRYSANVTILFALADQFAFEENASRQEIREWFNQQVHRLNPHIDEGVGMSRGSYHDWTVKQTAMKRLEYQKVVDHFAAAINAQKAGLPKDEVGPLFRVASETLSEVPDPASPVANPAEE